MKRSRIRQRRKGKSRPLDDTTLYDEYREKSSGVCEVGFFTGVGMTHGAPRMLAERINLRLEIQRHHIFSIGRRPDRWSNLIILTAEMHAWVQSVEPQKGRVLCLLAKIRKRTLTGRPNEFTLAEINECAGKNVIGVVQGYEFKEERWRGWRNEVLGRLEELELDKYEAWRD